jgi:FkbM family methyltransferase
MRLEHYRLGERMINRDDVIWAYLQILGRDPESDEVIDQQRNVKDLGVLIRALLRSREYIFKERSRVTESDVQWAYREFLGREVESEGAMAGSLSAVTLGNLIRHILGSDEFRIREPKVFQLPDQWVIFESPRGFRLWVNTSDVAVSGQVMRGTYESDEVAFISSHLKPGDTAIDVGANIGYLTHVMATAVGAVGRVMAFEPHPVLYQRLALSVAENSFSQCKLHNVALGNATGDADLEFGLDGANFGGMRLLGKDAAATIAKCKVPICQLDDVVDASQRVDFIKIDVEGSEPLVIQGATKLLHAQRPVIMSEILGRNLYEMHGMSASDYTEQVCSIGYQCRVVNPGGRIGDVFRPNGIVEFANVVFLPQQ